jgi:recombination protein RecA
VAKEKEENQFAKRSMSDALKYIEKKFGKESIISEGTTFDIPRQSTGFHSFDSKSGGGIPLGRIIELFGEEGCGKSTFALQVCKQFQLQKEKNCIAYFDYENSLDMNYCKMLGVNLDKEHFLLLQPETLETGIDEMRVLINTSEIGCVVVDSVAAMVPQAELEGESTQGHMGLQARGMGHAFRTLVRDLNKTKTPVIFINQMRAKIGGFGNINLETPGGKALKFYASMRIWVTTGKSNWWDDGKHSKFRIIKNKTSFMQNQIAELELMPGKGFLPNFDLFTSALDAKIIKEEGRGYLLGKKKMSLEEILEALDTKADIREKLIKLIEEKSAKA